MAETDKCNTCLERRKPYPKNLRESGSASSCGSGGGGGGILGFFSSKPKEEACGPPPDTCGDACGSKSKPPPPPAPAPKPGEGGCCDCNAPPPEDECKKPKLGTGAKPGSPMPASEVPALMMPAWFKCPPKITIAPFETPKGEIIRPISEGGRNNKCEGGACAKCGQTKPVSQPPKVSGNCPMVRVKSCSVAGRPEEKKEGTKPPNFFQKMKAMFGFKS